MLHDTRNLVALRRARKYSLWVDKELPKCSYCTIICSSLFFASPRQSLTPKTSVQQPQKCRDNISTQELWGRHRRNSSMVAPAPRSTIKSTIPVRNAPFQSITLPGQWHTSPLTYLWIATAVIFHPTQRTIPKNTGPKAKFRAEPHLSSEKVLWGPQLLCSWLPPASSSYPNPTTSNQSYNPMSCSLTSLLPPHWVSLAAPCLTSRRPSSRPVGGTSTTRKRGVSAGPQAFLWD